MSFHIGYETQGICGVFGVSSDDYLDYAKENNRHEWESKGI
jgi:hypothetical protein